MNAKISVSLKILLNSGFKNFKTLLLFFPNVIVLLLLWPFLYIVEPPSIFIIYRHICIIICFHLVTVNLWLDLK